MSQAKSSHPAWALPVAMFVVSQLITASGIYAAIRADLREVQVRVAIVEKRVDREEDRR